LGYFIIDVTHPDTKQNVDNQDIHANHLEGFNSALRRRMACYRCKTNTYAKKKPALQTRLDAYWVLQGVLFWVAHLYYHHRAGSIKKKSN
jgi:hypothetical protein